MKFLIPLKRDLKSASNIFTIVPALSKLGHDVDIFVYYASNETKKILQKKGVNIYAISKRNYPTNKNILTRIFSSLVSNIKFLNILCQNNYDFLFILQWDYKFLKYFNFFFNLPIIHMVLEFNEKNYKYCKASNFTIMPELNRAMITYFQAKLKTKPFILPNIPISNPLDLIDHTIKDPKIELLKKQNKKIVIYQGTIHVERRCLKELFKAITLLSDDIVLVVMPALSNYYGWKKDLNGIIQKLNASEKIFIIDSKKPPEHLSIIKSANIGIGLYKQSSINNYYCAPNRIYEFTGLGIPSILPNSSGMQYYEEKYKCFITCDPSNPQSIANSIKSLLETEKYNQIKNGSKMFYKENGNYLVQLDKILNKIKTMNE